MEQRRIGSVQPIGGYKTFNLIAGACLKYGQDETFKNSLIEYIEKLLNKEKN